MKAKTIFSCQNCGYQSSKWLGRCPDCNMWNSFIEENYLDTSIKTRERVSLYKEEPVLLRDVKLEEKTRLTTNIEELDRVLGGGLVCGSVILLGGEPGIGKSTISLQLSNSLTHAGYTVFYVSGEESVSQTRIRANRLLKDRIRDNFYIVSQTDLSLILEYIKKITPHVVIIDSIQVIFDPSVGSSAGTISQIRECAGILAHLAKSTNTVLIIIGHVTKEGIIAGPKVLEHIVDTVLYFEGDRFSTLRILRAVKNRFGSTNEIGVFEMTSEGLQEVKSPSEIFLSERPQEIPGSVISAVLEGSRPLLIEIQALVSRGGFGYARRRTQGFDYNRLGLLVAVLEKRLGISLENEDVFVNVVGGIKVEDPALDLAVVLAIISAFKEKVVLKDSVIFGEIGLGGEVRSINQAMLRIKEAERLGFKNIFLPKNNLKNLNYKNKIKLIGVGNLKEILPLVFI
ncbi:MAG: DNA repair protein RadA [Candidatus Omnitrophica bacterium]|nr:DNA repair protein RadA [Candidatus Omnitrophota bacterium]